MEHTVQLEQSLGHYYHKDVDVNGEIVRKRVILARGYELIGSIAGVGVHKPARVVDENGIEVDNPIMRRENGTCVFVRIRAILFGRAENGNLRAIDLTLSYDVAGGLANKMFDMWAMNGYPDWGYLSNAEHAAKDVSECRFKGRAGIGGGNYFIYDLREAKVRRILQEHTQWSLTSDRTAATLVERNLMRRYFGFNATDDDGMVRFCSWPQADVEWDSITLADGKLVVDGDAVSPEVAEEVVSTTEEESNEEGSVSDQDTRTLIAEQVRRVGSHQKARALCKDVLKAHGIRWGDIGTTQNFAALVDIYAYLRDNGTTKEKTSKE